MGKGRAILAGGLAVIAVVAGTVAVRTANFAPKNIADGSDVRYIAVYDASTNDIGLSRVAGEPAQGRDFELWVIDGQQAPASLGVIPDGASARLPVSDEWRAKLNTGAVFAISLEPAGGSPTGAPTGPVVAVGDLKQI